MTTNILERYQRTPEGLYIISVRVKSHKHLYYAWDNSASYFQRDLDPNFVDYLYENAKELGGKPFVIQIYTKKRHERHSEKVRQSISAYFTYLSESMRNEFREQMFRILASFILGVIFIFLAIYVQFENPIVSEIFQEGLLIFGWVTMWQVVSGIIYDWIPISRKIRIYRKLSKTSVTFA